MSEIKEKRGWTNQELDSTIFMVALLLILAVFIFLCWKSAEFRDSDMAKSLIIIFSGAIGSMVTYFFTRKNQNGQQNGGTP